MKRITAKELPEYLRGRLGIIFGPDITLEPDVYNGLSNALAIKFSVEKDGNYLETGDRILDKPTPESELCTEIQNFITSRSPQSVMSNLAKLKFASFISASLDSHFEDRVLQSWSHTSVTRTLTLIADPNDACPPKSIPSYKLLGLITRNGFAACSTDYFKRRARWPGIVKQFADRVRSSPVLCVGMAGCKWILYDLLSAMVGDETSAPKYLVFLADDPLISDSQIGRILKGRTEALILDANISDVLRTVEDLERNSYSPLLPFSDSNDPIGRLTKYQDCIEYVGNHIKPSVPEHEKNMLLDLLFSPSVPRWDPYAYELDFRRSAQKNALFSIEGLLNPKTGSFESQVYGVRGGAAVGKTVFLKRLMYDLAVSKQPVFLVKPYWQEIGALFHDFFAEINKLDDFKGKPIIICVDDPLRMGSVLVSHIIDAAQANRVQILLLIGCRSSDWENHEQEAFTGNLKQCTILEINDGLTKDEAARLPGYLCKVGVSTDIDRATAQIRIAQSKNLRDWLSMLFWLIPNTKYSITSSIRDEYFRLGDAVSLTQVIVSKARECAPVLQKAYSMVAIAEHYGALIPIEVLVSALRIDFGVWEDAIAGKDSGWGILYEVDDADGSTVLYRTRNSIVCDTIKEVVNSGIVNRSGEVSILNEILAGCKGATQVYRQFVIKLLVNNPIVESLSYEDGMRLYTTATTAFGVPDKTVLHHMARWMKNKGHDPINAYGILKQALDAKPVPFLITEADEHIHTTMAATVLDGVEQKRIDVKEGTKIALGHLEKARNINFFNPNAVHVQAGIVLKIIQADASQSKNDKFSLINMANSDIDRCLLQLEGIDKGDDTSIPMLRTRKDNIEAMIQQPGKIKEDAEELWETIQSQEGFILESRRLYKNACDQNKGSKFDEAFKICEEYIKKVEAKNIPVAQRLLEVALHILYHWQVKRAIFRTGTSAPIRWQTIDDICNQLMKSKGAKDDTFYYYIHALCRAHLNNWPEANAMFAQIRQRRIPKDVLWMTRDFLYNPTGGLRQIQGVIRESIGRKLLAVEDLRTDFLLSTRGKWPRVNEIAHAYVQFTFGGPLAIDVDSI